MTNYSFHDGASHVTDAAGNLLERYTYSAFGQPSFFDSTSQPLNSSTYNIRHLFQGQLWTQETGLNDYRNRVEVPTMGVFLQPDPIGFKGDAANLYRFCGNDAVNRTDPMGLFQQPTVFLGYAPGQGLEGPGRDLAQRLGENNRKDLFDKLVMALIGTSNIPAQFSGKIHWKETGNWTTKDIAGHLSS